MHNEMVEDDKKGSQFICEQDEIARYNRFFNAEMYYFIKFASNYFVSFRRYNRKSET